MNDDVRRPAEHDHTHRPFSLPPAIPPAIAVLIVLAITWITSGVFQALNGLILAVLAWSAGVLRERYYGR